MKRYVFFLFISLNSLIGRAQDFKAQLYNAEYDVFFHIDFHKQSMMVPDHEIYGEVAGYLGKTNNSFYWIVLSADIKGNTATCQLINDYGSEDLTATLQQKNDSTYVLNQKEGSIIKVPHKGKWQKLPKQLTFIRKF